MFLKHLRLKNFRSCKATAVTLCRDLTVLVGENNAGKSNIVDALRLFFMPMDGRRDVYLCERDICKQMTEGEEEALTVEAEFHNLNDAQRGRFIVATDADGIARYGMKYKESETAVFSKPSFWAGKNEGADPEPGARDGIRVVYLPPLRDANRELASASYTRIEYLLKRLTGDKEQIDDLVKTAGAAFQSVEGHGVVVGSSEKVSKWFEELTAGADTHATALRFNEPSLRGLARDLRFFLQKRGMPMTDLSENGLGYANLLYLATVLIELASAKETDLTLFLVEEPEAHLHPQLQALVLDFLREKASETGQVTTSPNAPAGKIQIIVTTHSPNLTATIPIENVVVVMSSDTALTKTIPVASLGIEPNQLRKIDRYLDVTKASILYAKRTLVVEGLSEALLLPVIARKVVFKDDEVARHVFCGTTLLAVDGVDFTPYLKLLLKVCQGVRIAQKVGILTDEDPDMSVRRKDNLQAEIVGLEASHCASVFESPVTFESSLLLPENESMLKAVYLSMKPRGEADWNSYILGDLKEKQEGLKRLMTDKQIAKGDFAQRLAERIENGELFTAPAHLEALMKWIVA